MKRWLPYVAVIVAMLIWSGSGIAVKAALDSFSPMMLIIMRFSLGVSVMALVGLVVRACRPSSPLALQKVERSDWWLFALAAFFQPFLYYLLETISYRELASPTIAEAFLSTNPLIAPLFAWIFLKEHITRWNIAGIVLSSLGMVLLVLAGSENFELGNPWGILLALVTVCTAAAYSILLKRIPAHYNALSIVFWVQLLGLLLFFISALLSPQSINPSYHQSIISSFSPQGDQSIIPLLAIAYLGLLSGMTAFILFCYSVRHIGVTQANVFNNIRPVFTALLMLCFFAERMPWTKWLGIVVIVIGLFICQIKEKSDNS